MCQLLVHQLENKHLNINLSEMGVVRKRFKDPKCYLFQTI